jgi:hypothetical protein
MPPPAQPELPQMRFVDPDDPDVFRDYVWENDIGGDLLLLANCGPLRNGAAVAGRCDLSIVPGSISGNTCTIRRKWRKVDNAALLLSSWNEINGDVSGILLDGETAYYNLVPGWQIVFNAVGVGIVDTHTAHVTQGDYLGSFADGNPDAPTPGDPVYEERLAMKNTGSDIAKNVILYCNRPRLLMRLRAGGGGLEYARVTTSSPVPKITGGQIKPYKLVFAENAGDPSLFDMTVDGLIVAQMIRIINGATVTSEALEPGERYRFVTTGLTDVEIKISATVADGDGSNLLLWPPDPTEISVDNSGSPVAFDDADVLAGDVSPGSIAYGHGRVFANIGSGDWNPILASIGMSYLKTGAAAIDED